MSSVVCDIFPYTLTTSPTIRKQEGKWNNYRITRNTYKANIEKVLNMSVTELQGIEDAFMLLISFKFIYIVLYLT